MPPQHLLSAPALHYRFVWGIAQQPTAHAQVEGNLVKWQKWEMRVSFDSREGMVLYDIGFAHGVPEGGVRPILHRASMPEMVVPYAEQQLPFHRRQAFGEAPS